MFIYIYMIFFIQFDWMFTHTLHNKSPRSWPWQEAQKLRAFKAQRLSSASVDVGDTLDQVGSTRHMMFERPDLCNQKSLVILGPDILLLKWILYR